MATEDYHETPSLIKNIEAERYDLVRQIDKHCQIDDKLQNLSKEVSDLKNHTRLAIEDVDSFLLKKERFREEIFGERNDADFCNADKEVDRDINIHYSRRSIISKDSLECRICGQIIQCIIYNDHLQICSMASNAGSRDNALNLDGAMIKGPGVSLDVAVRPTPPRNLRIKSVNHSSIHIVWEKSILDGGAPVLDYEIVYSVQSGGKKQVSKRECLLCSIYCLVQPLPENSFIIDYLTANTKYCDIKLRCKNKVGWSDFCQKIDGVMTADPVEPASPQNISVKDITATSMLFWWTAPFHNGGGTLDSYLLTYSEPVFEEKQSVGNHLRTLRLEKQYVNIPSDKTRFELRHLRGDTVYSSIQIVAISNFGFRSEPSSCNDVQTKQPTRLHVIKKEIEWARTCSREFIDTDFFQPGVLQRENRLQYIAKLENERQELDSNEPDQDTKHDNQVKDEDHNLDHTCKRERNFVYRINALKSEIIDHKTYIEANLALRATLTRQMATGQEKVLALRAEVQRITEATDDFVNSSILHGSKQQFRRLELYEALRTEAEGSVATIETCKSNILLMDVENKELSRSAELKGEHLLERQAAFVVFKKERINSSKHFIKVSTTLDMTKTSFDAWIGCVKKSQSFRKACTNIMKCRLCFLERHILVHWRNVAKYQYRLQELKMGANIVTSRGGSMLVTAEVARMNAHDEVKNAMKAIYSKSPMSNNDDNLLDGRLVNSMMDIFPNVRGDYYFNLLEYEQALHYYKTALEELTVTEMCTGDRSQIQCALLRKCGRSALAMNALNQAILYFEHLLNIANELKLESFCTLANLCLGQCYMHSGDMFLAKEHYITSLSQFGVVDNLKLQLAASQGLQACRNYDEGHALDALKDLDTSDVMDNHIAKKITDAKSIADTLQAQIRQATVHIGYTVPFQRVSCKYVKAQRRRQFLTKDIARLEKDKTKNRAEVERLPKLIANIESELHESQKEKAEGGSIRRVSALVHDNVQSFEGDELMQRLRSRMIESKAHLLDARTNDNLLEIQIRNAKDELVGIMEDLRLEQGELLQRGLMKQSIRLMALNSCGQIDESENADDYSLLIALTIGKDVFVYDSVTGTALNVFEGDTNALSEGSNQIKGHTAIITSLYLHGKFIFSGSKDTTLRCWNITNNQLEYVAKGHEATITSVHCTTTMLISGSADKRMILWDKSNGDKLRELNGHSRGVLALCEGNSTIVSGDADGDVLVWDANNFTISRRLEVHPKHKVTVVRSGKLEIVCGDAGGYVSIFWLETGEIVQQCKAHKTTITFLEFDATRIITSGMDCCLKVIDVTSCEILHTIREFDGPVLSLRFDTSRITTLSKDGCIKHWMWDSRSVNREGARLFHTVAKGETTNSISKIYDVSIADLIKWNDAKRIECGKVLIVGKGDDSLPLSSIDSKVTTGGRENISGQSQQRTWSERDTTVVLSSANRSELNCLFPEVFPDIKSEPTSLAARFTRRTDDRDDNECLRMT